MVPTLRRSSGLPTVFGEPFQALSSRWNQLFNRLMEDGGIGEEGFGAYPVDINEDDKHIYVEAELPGFKREEIDVNLEGGVLTISAERKVESKEQTKHLSERRFTRVQRSFSLPESVDEEKVEATLKDGVLHVTLNKRPETLRRKIKVQ